MALLNSETVAMPANVEAVDEARNFTPAIQHYVAEIERLYNELVALEARVTTLEP